MILTSLRPERYPCDALTGVVTHSYSCFEFLIPVLDSFPVPRFLSLPFASGAPLSVFAHHRYYAFTLHPPPTTAPHHCLRAWIPASAFAFAVPVTFCAAAYTRITWFPVQSGERSQALPVTLLIPAGPCGPVTVPASSSYQTVIRRWLPRGSTVTDSYVTFYPTPRRWFGTHPTTDAASHSGVHLCAAFARPIRLLRVRGFLGRAASN